MARHDCGRLGGNERRACCGACCRIATRAPASTAKPDSTLSRSHRVARSVWGGCRSGNVAPAMGGGRSTLYSLSRLGERIPPLSAKKSSVSPCALLALGAASLLGLVPAAEELLRRLFVAPLNVPHVCNMFVVLFPVGERPRRPAFLEQAQVVRALVVARVARAVDRVAGVGLDAVFVFFALKVVAEIVDLDVTINHKALGHVLEPRHPQSKVALRVGDG